MLGKKSGVAAQIKFLQPKAVENHCQGHSLSLSVKDTTKASRLLGNVMGTVAEITTLVKYSPKREQLLGSVKENIEIEHGDNDALDRGESLSKFCATRWTVRATTMRKVMTNHQLLFDIWDLCLEENLDRETLSRIVGCQSQMTTFRFFYGLNFSYTVYSLTDNLLKTLQSENMSAIEGKSIAMRTVETLDSMRNETASDLFFETICKKASKFDFIHEPTLSRKRKSPNYSRLTEYFRVDGRSKSSEPYHATTPKEHYRIIYFEVLDVMISSVKERFCRASCDIFANLESFLLQNVNHPEQNNEELERSISEIYEDDIDLTVFKVESNVLRTILKTKAVIFRDVYKEIKSCAKGEPGLIPNIVHTIKLLLVNPATSCTPERSFSTARRLKTWLRATVKSKRFNSLTVLYIHKEMTNGIDLIEIANEFVSPREGR